MKTGSVSSSGLLQGFRVPQYESLKEIQDVKGVTEADIVSIVNKYLRQKGPLVEAREKMSEELEKQTGFARQRISTNVPRVDDKGVAVLDDKGQPIVDVETEIDPKDTDKVYLGRFKAAILTGALTSPLFAIPTDGTPEAKEAALDAALQKFADGLGEFPCNAATPERKPKKEVKPKQTYINAATNIITNGSQEKWVKTFTKEKVEFASFTTGDKDKDIIALAWAIDAREKARAEKEYA